MLRKKNKQELFGTDGQLFKGHTNVNCQPRKGSVLKLFERAARAIESDKKMV